MNEISSIYVGLLLCINFILIGAHPPPPKGFKGQEIIGPIDWECANNGVFPYPDACDQYVDCWEDNANLWQCTDLMLFDLTYNGCNFAQYTHCDDRPRPTNVPSTLSTTLPTTTSNVSTTTTPRPPDDFDCPNDGVFPHAERCEYYWRCYAGLSELIHCPYDYLFDLRYMGCNFPEQTDCQDRVRPGTPSTTTRITTVATTTTPTQPPTTTVQTGPTTTADPNATTIATTTPVTTVAPTTSERPGDFECPDGVDGDFADPDDCSAFYTCVGGIPYHNYCPAGLYFNPLTDSCDYPENVDCDGRN